MVLMRSNSTIARPNGPTLSRPIYLHFSSDALHVDVVDLDFIFLLLIAHSYQTSKHFDFHVKSFSSDFHMTCM